MKRRVPATVSEIETEWNPSLSPWLSPQTDGSICRLPSFLGGGCVCVFVCVRKRVRVSMCMCTHAYTHSTNNTFKIISHLNTRRSAIHLVSPKINMIVCHLNQKSSSSLRSRYQRERDRNVSCYFYYFLYIPCQTSIQENMSGNLSMPYINRVNQLHTIHWLREWGNSSQSKQPTALSS